MSSLVQAAVFLMIAGMGTVFLSLAVFFIVIVLFEKLFKPNETEIEGSNSK
ncbi:MAG: OadG family protein [Spirochaetes bacterium]|nr:OadG family protein [Spirochaetota bacterium]